MKRGSDAQPRRSGSGAAAASVLASALLCGLYAQGGAAWMLGFIALVPWLRALEGARDSRGRMFALAYAFSVAYTAAVFPWFGAAIGRLADVGEVAGLLVLLLLAPLFQPQIVVMAWVRHETGRRRGSGWAVAAGMASWVVAETWLPRLLGDTLGHGLHPSLHLRQAADLIGTAGLTLVLLLTNEALARAWALRAGAGEAGESGEPGPAGETASTARPARPARPAWHSVLRPLAIALALPLLLAAYGVLRLASLPPPTGPTLRVGLVQSNITDYERLRRERGSGAVVREVLDTHYAMSHDAVVRQGAQVVMWSETVYPTTFAQPKSEAGAELDREIVGIVQAAGVPFVFGTYDRDGPSEYNAAAFVAPGVGLVGIYRKTRPFPFTEHVPAWLDTAWLRQLLPWTGRWQPGHGARVMPLRLADGRELPVLPLICLDAVDTMLAVDGARLGAQALLTMSNDAWFTERPQGAALHLAVAAFRSIETRLPQFRVTTNGFSAVIDAQGTVLAPSRMGERSLVVGELHVPVPPPTLLVAWGNWVPRLCAVLLAGLFGAMALSAWRTRSAGRSVASAASATTGTDAAGTASSPSALAASLPAHVVVLTPATRAIAAGLRVLARSCLLWMTISLLLGDQPLLAGTLAPLRMFAALVLAPEAAAWLVLRASRASLQIGDGQLRLQRGPRVVELPVHEIAAVRAWRLPLPLEGVSLQRAAGERWSWSLAGLSARALQRALQAAGGQPGIDAPTWTQVSAEARAAVPRGRLHQPWARFLLLPLLLALPAFRLHQHIAFGGTFGEWLTFGPQAYGVALLLWWASWIMAVAMCAAVLRAGIEAAAAAVAWWRPQQALPARRLLERIGVVALFAGLPGWLLLRLLWP